MRKISTRNLKKKAWVVFARWIRTKGMNTSGYVICVTCGVSGLPGSMNAGHFIHGHSKMTFLDERNVHVQCIRCNLYLSGNLIEYSNFMKTKYGWDVVDILRELSHKIWKPSRTELEDIITIYENKLSGID